jgi:hypothetical protein
MVKKIRGRAQNNHFDRKKKPTETTEIGLETVENAKSSS